MEYNNKMLDIAKRNGGIDRKTLETAIILIAPFAPHVSEELWSQMGHTGSVFDNTWPTYDKEKMKDSEIEIAVQINGKTRGTIMIDAEASKEAVLETVKKAMSDKITGAIIKEIYVPGRIVNIVVK
jgi:leucyl-tRNA synthetase